MGNQGLTSLSFGEHGGQVMRITYSLWKTVYSRVYMGIHMCYISSTPDLVTFLCTTCHGMGGKSSTLHLSLGSYPYPDTPAQDGVAWPLSSLQTQPSSVKRTLSLGMIQASIPCPYFRNRLSPVAVASSPWSPGLSFGLAWDWDWPVLLLKKALSTGTASASHCRC